MKNKKHTNINMWKYESRAKKFFFFDNHEQKVSTTLMQLEKQPVHNNKKQQFYSSVCCRVQQITVTFIYLFIYGITVTLQIVRNTSNEIWELPYLPKINFNNVRSINKLS